VFRDWFNLSDKLVPMTLNPKQQELLNKAAEAVKTAWDEQWTMIEEEDRTIAAEYLMTTAVARGLSAVAGGRVRIERLIGRAFRNTIVRGMCKTPVPSACAQGRIDVLVSEDINGFKPYCLVELKREFNRSAIENDADRIARLIDHTGTKLPDIFGFCLFPLFLESSPSSPNDYEPSKKKALEEVGYLKNSLASSHQELIIYMQDFSEVTITRPPVVTEFYDDGKQEKIWDNGAFRMMPAAIVMHKKHTA
jgi:hypothetical protein